MQAFVGAECDKIISLSSEILLKSKAESRLKASNPYGNGNSAKIIVDIIEKYFSQC